ncbi:hypothetical protein BN946_scf184911.g2 [Trametes cinnabarina]|uniref:t-SNARE coiled-coil homology domain-containing protein n=1 Tax=Pycnoporus cinnabarinus TaxID=5643 RepID=A0A060SAI8_PYCCI|nr:hypothetical protein BN946_scf184911.g2 [Trametes cinnabarina]
MSFFKRNKDKNLIPPPQSAQASRDELLGSRSGNSTSPRPPNSYPRSTATTYVPSRDGDPYNGPAAAPPPRADLGDRYTRQNAVGDVYSRGQRDIDSDRSELFSGYNPKKAGSGRFVDDASAARQGPPRRGTPPPGEENEEDVEGIKQSMRFLKQDSVNSTRNALRLAREAEETARNTVTKLGSQSEKLADTERHLDVSKGHSLRAEDKTDELKQLNRSIFRPAITFNKDAKRAAQEAKIQARYEEDRLEREKAMRDIRDTQDRLGRATTYGMRDDEEGIGGGSGSGRLRTAAEVQARKNQRSRYQFEADEEDDQLEDEIDDNLDEIADVSKRLKALGMAMGSELDTQNDRLTRITDKADKLDFDLYRNTQKLNRIK